MPSFLTKENLNSVSQYATRQIRGANTSFFVPYSAKDLETVEKAGKEMKTVLNAVLAYGGYDSLILVCGLAAAAIYAGKSFTGDEASSKESFEYSIALASASATMYLHMKLELLNFVSRVLATAVNVASTGAVAAVSPLVTGFFNRIEQEITKYTSSAPELSLN